jgi:hypothetical protein
MGTNDIRGGIARVREWLALGFIKIMPGACPNLLEEAQRYRYDTDRCRWTSTACRVRRDECKVSVEHSGCLVEGVGLETSR